VVFDVRFRGFGGVMRRVMMMAMRKVRVMRGEMMIAGFVMARGFTMMPGSVLVMFGCFVVVLSGLLGHKSSLGFLCGRLLGGRRLG
jgi:hypothetical protein